MGPQWRVQGGHDTSSAQTVEMQEKLVTHKIYRNSWSTTRISCPDLAVKYSVGWVGAIKVFYIIL